MKRSRLQVLHWAGLAIILAGVLWMAFAMVLSSRPEGCVDAACDLPGRSYRTFGTLAPGLFIAAALFLVGGVAVVAWSAWKRADFGMVGRVGLLLSAVGGALIAVPLVIQMLFFNGDFPLMPFFVIPGLLALIVGFLLLGSALVRARMVPRWAGVLLLLSALVLLGFNTEDVRVLLAVPLGLSWVVVGAYLLTGQEKPQEERVAQQQPRS
ncbi:MAG: hypothetical protein NVSMB38_09030 [Ktedonobacteraceae bacterium]